MEGRENIPHIETPEKKESSFNFVEIENLKTGMVNLVRKLKGNIDNNKYDALISDEIGGRIPTLVIREVIKSIHPEAKINTHFIAGGYYIPHDDSKGFLRFCQYVKDSIKEDKSILLITQYVHTGGTLRDFALALSKSGVDDFDIGVVNSEKTDDDLGENVFVGTDDTATLKYDQYSRRFAGVAKKKKYDPKLYRLPDVMSEEGRDRFMTDKEYGKELWKIYGIDEFDDEETARKKMADEGKRREFQEQMNRSITAEESKKMTETVRMAREDVKTMAAVVLKEVWSDPQPLAKNNRIG